MPRTEYYRDPNAPAATHVAVAVFAIIRDDVGSILLVRRADNGNWEPPGGHIEPGETTTTALTREVLEESGVRVAATSVAGIYTDPDHVMAYPITGVVSQQFAVYLNATPIGGQPRGDGQETSAATWFTSNELRGLTIQPGIRARLDQMLHQPSTTHLG